MAPQPRAATSRSSVCAPIASTTLSHTPKDARRPWVSLLEKAITKMAAQHAATTFALEAWASRAAAMSSAAPTLWKCRRYSSFCQPLNTIKRQPRIWAATSRGYFFISPMTGSFASRRQRGQVSCFSNHLSMQALCV